MNKHVLMILILLVFAALLFLTETFYEPATPIVMFVFGGVYATILNTQLEEEGLTNE